MPLSTAVEPLTLAPRTSALTYLQTYLPSAEPGSFLLEPIAPHKEKVFSYTPLHRKAGSVSSRSCIPEVSCVPASGGRNGGWGS